LICILFCKGHIELFLIKIILEILRIIKWKVVEFMFGQMVKLIEVNGKITF